MPEHSRCPLCGAPIGIMVAIQSLSLGRITGRALEYLAARRGQYAETSLVIAAAYADEPDGGPEAAAASLAVQFCKARPKLAAAGLVLRGDRGRGSAGYCLDWNHRDT